LLLLCFDDLGIDVGGRVGMGELQAGRAVSEFEKWAVICVCSWNSAAVVVIYFTLLLVVV
jgi:hypothetical protein